MENIKMYNRYRYLKITKRKQGKKDYTPPPCLLWNKECSEASDVALFATANINKAYTATMTCCANICRTSLDFFGFTQGTYRTEFTMTDIGTYDWSWLVRTTSRKISILLRTARVETLKTDWVGYDTWGSPVVSLAPPEKGKQIATVA